MRWFIVGLVAFFAFSMPVSAAIDERETVTIPVEHYYQFQLQFYSEGDPELANSLRVPLKISVTVHNGPNANIFLLDADDFERYQRDEAFAVVQGVQVFDTRTYSTEISILEKGDFYLVLDNFDYEAGVWPDQETVLTYELHSEDVEKGAPGLGAVALAIGILAVGMARRRL